MDVYVSTLGCRLNQFDSDALERKARELGHRVVNEPGQAQLHVINTCTITHEADADSRQLIRRVQRNNPAARTIVTGCWATAEPDAAATLPGVIRVVGNAEKAHLFDGLNSDPGSAPPTGPSTDAPDILLGELFNRAAPPHILQPALNPARSRAYLKVQDGCDYKCSFCIVPAVRGPSRSLAIDDLLDQVDQLVAAGQAEICLTGVHLGTYGRDLSPRRTLVDLIAAMLPRLRGARLRLGSLDPHEVSDGLIELMEEHSDQICRYLHLPVQSGDPDVLRLMRRAHSVDDLIDTVNRVSARLPQVGLGSDVIVGFPGEGEREFENTRALLEALPLTYLHVFSYSKRSGTAAVELAGHVSRPDKRRRSRVLRELSATKSHSFAESLRDRLTPALVLTSRHRRTGRLTALTDNYVKVQLDGPDSLMKSWASLEVTGVGEASLVAPV